VVAVLTRHNLHARLTLNALKAGKAVYCEKPLAITLDELTGLEDYLRTSQSPVLMVGFNRRFAPLAVGMKRFFTNRVEPAAIHYRVNAGFLPPSHWTQDSLQGGGRIIGEACHFIDFMTYLVGEPPVQVFGQALPDNGRYHNDNVILNFTFPDGSVGTVSYLANGDKSYPKEQVEMFAGGYVAVLNDFRSLEMVRDGRHKVISSHLNQDKGHKSSWEAFINSIQVHTDPPIPYHHLIQVTRASFAALESIKSNLPVIIS
jgi:predicted dehydrogenase